ncbi:hypothetical protein BaRGS_00013696 [Batillaria attramentaria]|uniref:Ig-like domain-containing protein n=1 Tax=Batillaria attramentaria TaxID=370345 RepID=A0ABD0L6B0_9CAEN
MQVLNLSPRNNPGERPPTSSGCLGRIWSIMRNQRRKTQAVGDGYVQLDYSMRNVTKYRTQSVRLRCEITGSPIPAYTWYKNNTPLNDGEENGRISIRRTTWGSRSALF